MKKPPAALSVELNPGGISGEKASGKFKGTKNWRHAYVLGALLKGNCTRKEIEAIADVSNGPGLIAYLRRLGLSLPCKRVPKIDKYGSVTWIGVYSMNEEDFWKFGEWFMSLPPT